MPASHVPAAVQAAARILPNFHHLTLGFDFLDGGASGSSHWFVPLGYSAVLAGAIIWKYQVEEARGLA